MISKAIFKQTLKANYKLWMIFTALISVFLFVIIAVYDPKIMQSMLDMMKDLPMAKMGSSMMDNMGTLLGSLGGQFYSMLAVILPMIYILITANGLVASKVDRGSMAYLLSTPTKRSSVVGTQAAFLIGSVVAMFLVVSIVGMTSVQIFHSGLWGTKYTADVISVSETLDIDKQALSDDLTLILNNPEAVKAGAEAREVDEDIYSMYLNLKIADMTGEVIEAPQSSEEKADMQEKMTDGFVAAAEVLNIEVADLTQDMKLIKMNSSALDAAVEASGIPKEMFLLIVNTQLAQKELSFDKGIEFDIFDYLMLNLGCFLLMLAISGISFLFSCVFNLSKNSLALGAGIPIAFFIFQIMAQISDSLNGFKYLTLNTLFDTDAIVNGGSYWLQFAILGFVGILLYFIGMRTFKEKDLPL